MQYKGVQGFLQNEDHLMWSGHINKTHQMFWSDNTAGQKAEGSTRGFSGTPSGLRVRLSAGLEFPWRSWRKWSGKGQFLLRLLPPVAMYKQTCL